jgi:hypothetical protein
MATIAVSSPQTRFTVAFFAPEAQGREGQSICKATNEVLRHLNNRAERLMHQTTELDDVSYDSVPPNRTFVVRVRYRFTGRAEPFPYQLDE